MDQYYSREMCKVFHALGDPSRMAILQQIGQGEATAGELAGPLNITLTATLKHLKVLEDAGLTVSEKVGRERRCRVREESFHEIERWIRETRRAWMHRLDQLEIFLQESESNL